MGHLHKQHSLLQCGAITHTTHPHSSVGHLHTQHTITLLWGNYTHNTPSPCCGIITHTTHPHSSVGQLHTQHTLTLVWGIYTHNTPSPHMHAPIHPPHAHTHTTHTDILPMSTQQPGAQQTASWHSTALLCKCDLTILYRESDRGNTQKEGRSLEQQRVGWGGGVQGQGRRRGK